jgi:hypothetical protein
VRAGYVSVCQVSRLPADAPIHLRVGTFEEFFITALLLVVALALTPLVLRGTRGADRSLYGLVLVGAALCIVFEPFIDRLGGIWYAKVNQHLGVIQLWGVRPGAHMLIAYYLFLGVAAVAIVRYVRNGAGERELWRLYGMVFVLAVVLEAPILWVSNVYAYYGHNQPFFNKTYWPLPLWYPVVNATLPFCIAAFALLLSASERRWHRSLIPVVMPSYLFAIYVAQAWPVLTAMNTKVDKWVAYVGGIGTMALALIAARVVTQALPRLARRGAPVPGPAPALAPPVADKIAV